jgi:micrococcal nuclease
MRWNQPFVLPLAAGAITTVLIVGAARIATSAPDTDVGTGADSGISSETAVVRHFTLCWEDSTPDCVIDGDTIHIDGEPVQISDIDAPEAHHARCAAQQRLGERATQRLLQLLNSGPFELVQEDLRGEDRYGRKLRVLERGGESIGGILVGEGLARPWGGARENWCDG